MHVYVRIEILHKNPVILWVILYAEELKIMVATICAQIVQQYSHYHLTFLQYLFQIGFLSILSI